MSNLLFKDRPQVIILSPAIPAVPSTPPIPAYDEVKTTGHHVAGPIVAWGGYEDASQASHPLTGYSAISQGATKPPAPIKIGSVWIVVWEPIYGPGHIEYTTEVIHHPAVPGTPGSPAVPADIVVENNVGWNAGAISVPILFGTGQYQFTADPNSVGVVTGLNPYSAGVGYNEIDYTFYCDSGKFQVMESGDIKTGPALFDAGDRFTVVRIGDHITYWQNTTLVYTSLVRMDGPLYADCSLYFGDDRIIDASISDTVDPDLTTGSGVGSGSGVIVVVGSGAGYGFGGSAFQLADGRGTIELIGVGGRYNSATNVVPPGDHDNDGEPDGDIAGVGGPSSFALRGQGLGHDFVTSVYAGGLGSFEVIGIGAASDSVGFLAPQYSVTHGSFQLAGWGLVDNVSSGIAPNAAEGGGTIVIIGNGANYNYTEGHGEIRLEGWGFDNQWGHLDALLFTGRYVLWAFGSTGIPVDLMMELPALTGIGYGGGVSKNQLQPLTMSAHGAVVTIARLSAKLPMLRLTASGTAPDVGRLNAQLPHGYHVKAYGGAIASLKLPKFKLVASGTAPVIGRMQAELPNGLTLRGYGGGVAAKLKLTKLHLVASGTAPIMARLQAKLPQHWTLAGYAGGSAKLKLPKLKLVVSATTVDIGRLDASLPDGYHVTAYGGGGAQVQLPKLKATASGTVWLIARLDKQLPKLLFTGSGTVSQLARLDALLPKLSMVSSGRLAAQLHSFVLVASGTVGTTPGYEAYNVTFLETDQGETGIAVTHFEPYPFDRIVRWRDKYYGVARDGLYELSGDTFDDAPIVAVIETAHSDAEHVGWKRVPGLYISGVVGDDMKVGVQSPEFVGTRAGLRRNERSRMVRYIFGKGTRIHYYGYQFTNIEGEDFSIDALTPEIDKLKRAV